MTTPEVPRPSCKLTRGGEKCHPKQWLVPLHATLRQTLHTNAHHSLYAGRDATEEFEMIHPSDVIQKYAPECVIGTVKK